jgi:hypothetical protein
MIYRLGGATALCALLAKEEARVKDVQRVHGEHNHGTIQHVCLD